MSLILSFMKRKTHEAEHNFIAFGFLTLIGYPLFYFLNYITKQKTYDSFSLRFIAVILGLLLILHKKWPKKLIKFKPYYWYFSITFILPYFFTFLLLKNPNDIEGQLNALIILTLLILLLDWISVIFVTLIGILSAALTYYVIEVTPHFPQNIIPLINTIISLLIYCALFSSKSESMQNTRRLRLEFSEKLNDQLEQKVHERTAELEQALEAKTEFLNNMSHEIRTPIQGFTTISQGLVEHWQEFSDTRKFELAAQVSKNARRLSSLLKHLLDLSKFNAGKILLDLKPCNLNDVIAEIIQECKELYMNGKQLDIQFTAADIPPIMLDLECMGQVLRNLLINAIKFSPNKSIITILLEATEISYDNGTQTKALHFTIIDQGVGIPDNELNSIFAPFTQSTRTKTKAGGTGLGLAIVKEIIEAHHGKIWAENNLDQGSSFHFIIPITQSKQLDNHKIIAENEILKIDLLTKQEVILPKTVLIIDDEEACLISMELLLYNSNYKLIKAISGKEGIKYLKNNANSVDLILLDLMIPDMYGLNILSEIKQDAVLAHIPVILQSGTSDSEGIEKAYELGIIAYIKKPYQKQIIIAELNKAFS